MRKAIVLNTYQIKGLIRSLAYFLCLSLFLLNAATLTMDVTVNPTSVTTGDTVDYKIKHTNNTSQKGKIQYVECDLPSGFTYVSGSTAGAARGEPTLSGNTLKWYVNRNIKVGKSRTVRFKAKSSLTRGDYTINTLTYGTDFDTTSTNSVASLECTGPVLALNKAVNNTSSDPGDTLTYTLTYMNSGDGAATFVFIMESIPANTEYVVNSASGSSMIITYSENGGSSYGSSQSTSVTDIMFQLSGSLSSGGSGSISYKVIVN